MPEHRGPLTPAQAAEGINRLKENSFRLLVDSTVMFLSGRYPTALLLAVLAIEEAGKRSFLQEIVAARTSPARKLLWASWRDHAPKLSAALKNLIAYHILKVTDRAVYRDMVSAIDVTVPKELLTQKEAATYVHCLPGVQWSIPDSAVDKKAVQSMFIAAVILTQLPRVTDIEVRAWARHIAPARGKRFTTLRKAYLAYTRELQAAGVFRPGAEQMIDSVFTRINTHLRNLNDSGFLTRNKFESIRQLIPKNPLADLVDNSPSSES